MKKETLAQGNLRRMRKNSLLVLPLLTEQLYNGIVDFVREEHKASICSIQKAFRCTFAVAQKALQRMEQEGVVSKKRSDGRKAFVLCDEKEVIYEHHQLEAVCNYIDILKIAET